ncbi:MAG: hypothetical protein G3M70_01930 [Candidatus Nitronauta litoralis]|uniref:THIF-type NAD/FAD binding fold domain-containing protein n=1 Tax=Candidatus Nitronauta litoralis TaxID=2705533 RepID=A0A7T0BUJ1_9BACT|nr:MAG: hypothetical protein G3M70_01930 [Candidatus Nitronauta litoralis]
MEDTVLNILDNLKVQLPRIPKLAAWASVVDVGDSRLQFRGNDFIFTLENELFFNVFKKIHTQLDGNHSLNDILDSGSDSFRPTTIEFLLKTLYANGLIHENKDPEKTQQENWAPFSSQINFLSRFTSTPLAAFQKIRSAKIVVTAQPQLQKNFNACLTGMGFKEALFFNSFEELKPSSPDFEETNIDLLIPVSEKLDFKLFSDINSFCHAMGIKFCCMAIESDKALLGPMVIPFQSPCIACLKSRYFAHEKALPHLNDIKNSEEREINIGISENIDPFVSVMAGEMVLEITRYLTGIAPPKTIGGVYEYSGLSPIPKRHQIFKVPGCMECSHKTPKTAIWGS